MNNKLVSGILLTVISVLYFYVTAYSGEIEGQNGVMLKKAVGAFFYNTFVIFFLAMFIKGLSNLYYFKNGYSINYTTYSGQNNIDRMIDFRNAKMGAMSLKEASELLKNTQVLDMAKSARRYGNNTERAAGYLDGKLGAMNLEDGLEYLKNK